MLHLFKNVSDVLEYCFNIETNDSLSSEEITRLRSVLADSFSPKGIVFETTLLAKKELIVEIGPRLNFATFWSSNFLSLCRSIGLDKVVRIERSRRYAFLS